MEIAWYIMTIDDINIYREIIYIYNILLSYIQVSERKKNIACQEKVRPVAQPKPGIFIQICWDTVWKKPVNPMSIPGKT